MNRITHVMLDLETWGTKPGCDIRSIGACVFDPVTGVVGNQHDPHPFNHEFYTATDNPTGYWGKGSARSRFFTDSKSATRKYRLTRDKRTEDWWADQSDEAKAAFTDPVDLKTALERFTSWLNALDCDSIIEGPSTNLRLWSHGPQFDGPILAAAYDAVDLPVPWHYRAPRDTRTCFDMAGIDDHSAWLAQFSGDDRVQHHALSDAICQARAVCAAWGRVTNWRETREALEGADWRSEMIHHGC